MGMDRHKECCAHLQSTGHQEVLCHELGSQSSKEHSFRGVGLFFILVILWHEFGGMNSASAPSRLSSMAVFLPSLPPLAVPSLC